MDRWTWQTMAMVASLALVFGACAGGEDVGGCTESSCQGHGSCSVVDGQAVCACEDGYTGSSCGSCAPGYQDHDGDGECAVACGTSGPDCPEHAICEDDSGEARCVCEQGYSGDDCAACALGYQDNDGDSSCLPDCDTAELQCDELGSCDDSSGQALCVCQEGYQDNDGNGSCMPDCDTVDLTCGPNSVCDDASGQAQCVCGEGYTGVECTDCASGYQDNDGDGECLPGCDGAGADCGIHGQCDDSLGMIRCACDEGYTGSSCGSCAAGYQDHDGDEVCSPTCATAELDCGAGGSCDDTGGAALCVCEPEYQGALCENCAAGFQDKDGDGVCLANCDTAGLDCGAHGLCDDSLGVVACACEQEYSGELCDACAVDYQDHDGDGICTAACSLVNCQPNAGCDDGSGTALCSCLQGYAEPDCDSCASGYQDHDGDGSCLPDCDTAALDCGAHGLCDDEGGEATCQCAPEYTGAQCQLCAAGYQDNDGDGECLPDCGSAGLSCSAYSHCDDEGGEALCVCDDGYVEPDCTACTADYQDTDGNGSCLPTCEYLGWTCSGHGTCGYENGEAVCFCDTAGGYFPDGLGNCLNADAGNDCLLPLELDLSVTSVSGSTPGSGDDYVGSCQSYGSAEEVVYHFNLSEALTITFDLSGSSYDTMMYLRSDCTDPNSELACDDDGGESLTSMFSVDLQPGDYYLFIDGYSTNTGNYTLSLDVGCGAGTLYDVDSGQCVPDPCLPNPCSEAHQTVCEPQLPASYYCLCDPGYIFDTSEPPACIPDPNPYGESCADVIPLVGSAGTVSGTTADAANDGVGDCAGNGPDRVYGITLTERSLVLLDLNGLDNTDTVLHVRAVCDDPASEVGCDDDGGPGTSSTLDLILDAGSYYIWADSYSSGGPYELVYSMYADPCADEEAVCPGNPICQASADWSSYECVCGVGMLPYGNDCVPDPCTDTACQDIEHRNRCVPNEADGFQTYTCECNVGYIEDLDNPPACIMDPDANDWAFFVFLNADNNLESDGYDDVSEMTAAGSTAHVHIVALFDTLYGDNGDARIIRIDAGSTTLIENWNEVDMSDWRTLRDFGVWAVEHYPARHYAMIMWDHGAGWKAEPQKKPLLKGFSNDDTGTAGEISISNGDYAQAMAGIVAASGAKLDLVGFDACLMGMWEVAEASAPYANYLVASSETEPAAGWPYDDFLPGLVADYSMTAEELGISIVDAYYNESSSNDTLAVTDLNSMDDLAAAMDVFAGELMNNTSLYTDIESVRQSTQQFYYFDDFRDLQDFAERVAAMGSAPVALQQAAQGLVDQLELSIVYSRAHSNHPGSNGLAIYFPSRSSSMDSAYRDSGAIWTRTLWDDFLVSFTQ